MRLYGLLSKCNKSLSNLHIWLKNYLQLLVVIQCCVEEWVLESEKFRFEFSFTHLLTIWIIIVSTNSRSIIVLLSKVSANIVFNALSIKTGKNSYSMNWVTFPLEIFRSVPRENDLWLGFSPLPWIFVRLKL